MLDLPVTNGKKEITISLNTIRVCGTVCNHVYNRRSKLNRLKRCSLEVDEKKKENG